MGRGRNSGWWASLLINAGFGAARCALPGLLGLFLSVLPDSCVRETWRPLKEVVKPASDERFAGPQII